MRKTFFALLLFAVSLTAGSQGTQADILVSDGVALHDKGDYNGAIGKYDEALKLDPNHEWARYEKAFSLMSLNKNDEAAQILEKLLRDGKDPKIRISVFLRYGTLLDLQGDGKRSVKVYEDGIKEFPDHYLLPYNKGITQTGLGDREGALASFKRSVSLNPAHVSSHIALGQLTLTSNRIPSIFAFFSALLLEPTGERAKKNLVSLDKAIMKGVEKKDDKNTVITIDASLFDKKNKPKEDDFTSAEMLFSLVAARDDVADSIGAKTDADKLSYKLQMLVNVLEEKDKDKGFFKTFYVPFFKAIKEQNLMITACYVAMAESGKDDILKWLKDNRDKTDAFYTWMKAYKWEVK